MADASSHASRISLWPANQPNHGVLLADLVALDPSGAAMIRLKNYPELDLPRDTIAARVAAQLSKADVGCEVAVMFEGGQPVHPIVIGRMQLPAADSTLRASIQCDGDRLVLTAPKEIVLHCGKATITLTRAGKILLKGAYLLSRSSGLNRILGGVVQIN